MKVNLSKITTKGKALFLAYDQGLEHGPTDFNDKNIDPQYVLDIAEKGKFNGIVFQKGIAEKYYDKKKNKVPLILKLNGKTKILKGDPISPQLCTVKEAIKLGASAVGYTIYVGSSHEVEIFQEFEKIQREAHANGLPVIVWIYPRGKAVPDELDGAILAYGARVGLELGADIVKMKYNGKPKDLKWMVKSAGKTKMVIAGGSKKDVLSLLKEAKEVVKAGCIGLAIGRNIWQHENPLKIARALKDIVFNGKTVSEAKKRLK